MSRMRLNIVKIIINAAISQGRVRISPRNWSAGKKQEFLLITGDFQVFRLIWQANGCENAAFAEKMRATRATGRGWSFLSRLHRTAKSHSRQTLSRLRDSVPVEPTKAPFSAACKAGLIPSAARPFCWWLIGQETSSDPALFLDFQISVRQSDGELVGALVEGEDALGLESLE